MKKIKLTINQETIEKDFTRIATELMNNWQLVCGDHQYRIAEIEFYLKNDEWHRDVYTHSHEQQLKSHHWYFHGSGIDLTFGTQNYYGGILFRAVYEFKNGIYTYGPLKILQELFSHFPEVCNTNPVFGLVPYQFDHEKPIAAPRVGLNPKYDKVFCNKNYRFLIMPKKKHADKTRIALAMATQGYSEREIQKVWG